MGLFLREKPRELQRMERAEKLGIFFDKRSKEEVVNDLRNQGIEAYPVLHPDLLLKDNPERNFVPLGSISRRTLVMDNETGTYETFTSDEHGFHNPPGSWGDGSTDILIVGDSFAMGANVRSGADIRSQLATYGKKVITIGMNGNGPLLGLAGLIEYGKYLKPKIVLWLYFEGNDLDDLAINKYSMLKDYLNDNFCQNLPHRQSEIDKLYLEFFDKVSSKQVTVSLDFKRNLFEFLIMDKLRNRLTLIQDPYKPILPHIEPILQKAKSVATSWGGSIYFVYLPDSKRYSHNKDDSFWSRDKILSIVKKVDIPIIDFHETIKKQKDPLDLFPFRLHGHYNETGYRLLAAAIMSGLEKNTAAEHYEISPSLADQFENLPKESLLPSISNRVFSDHPKNE